MALKITTVTAGDESAAREALERIFKEINYRRRFADDFIPEIAEAIARERNLALMAVAAKHCHGCAERRPRVFLAEPTYWGQSGISRGWCHESRDNADKETTYSQCDANAVFEVIEEWAKPHEHTNGCFAYSLGGCRVGRAKEPLCGHTAGQDLRTKMLSTS